MFFNNFIAGPNSPGNFQQPNAGNPASNPAVANFVQGSNPLGVNGVDQFWQPGGVSFGHFDPNSAPITCPLDGTTTQIVGSGDFHFFCSTCQHQFRADGTMFQRNLSPTPLIMPPNDSFSGSQWPTDQLPPTDLSNVSD